MLEEIAMLRSQVDQAIHEKEQIEQESKMSDEIRHWKRELEDTLDETRRQLETETETR